MPEVIATTKNKSQKNTKRKSAQASFNVKQIEDSHKNYNETVADMNKV